MPLRWAASRRIEFDENGERAAGAIAYFWLAGTTTPITVYQDAGLSTPHEQDDAGALAGASKADSIGRWPEVWIEFSGTAYRERVVTASGALLWDTDNITRSDPVEASEDTVDDEELLQTGHIHFELVNTTKAGFVRLNARSIGSAASGATERANADTEPLYTYLWNNLSDTQAPVSTGRGANAAADFAANKTLTLPDFRSATPMGVDNMGNSSGGFLASAPFTHGNATTAGSAAGLNTHTLTTAQLPTITPAGSVAVTGSITFPSASRSVTVSTPTGTIGAGSAHSNPITAYTTHTGGATTGLMADTDLQNSTALATGNENAHTHIFTGDALTASFNQNTLTATWASTAATFTGTSFGSGAVHNIVSRVVLGTWFIRL